MPADGDNSVGSCPRLSTLDESRFVITLTANGNRP